MQSHSFFGSSHKKQPLGKGTTVRTFLGPVQILHYRSEDSVYEVTVKNWHLANGKCASAYLKADVLKDVIKEPQTASSGSSGIGSALRGTLGAHTMFRNIIVYMFVL
jgi:hypothetical protein